MKSWIFLEDEVTEQAETFFRSWSKQQPSGGIMALVSENSQTSIPALQSWSRENDMDIVGAVFPSIIVAGELKDKGVLLLWLNEMPNYCIYEETGAFEPATPSMVDCILQLIDEEPDSHFKKTLFLIFDCMVPNISTQLDELYSEIGDEVYYCGVNAGSETFEPISCLFDQNRMIQNGVLASLLKSEARSYLKHGYRQLPGSVIGSTTKGNRVEQINCQPAFNVYQQMVKDHYDTSITKENFYQYASHFPLGIKLAVGESLVRIPVKLEDDGSILCVGEIAENSLLTVMEGIEPEEKTVTNAILEYSTQFPDGLDLLFYCAGRRIHLGAATEFELKRLEQSFSPGCMVGALTLGEIGSVKQSRYPLFHNAAIVAIARFLQ